MIKALGKTIVKMSKLETKYSNNSTLENRSKYKKQKGFAVIFQKREEKMLFESEIM